MLLDGFLSLACAILNDHFARFLIKAANFP
jgi:hypothetical protein